MSTVKQDIWRLRATINGERVYGGHIGNWAKVEALYPQLAKAYKPRKKRKNNGKKKRTK